MKIYSEKTGKEYKSVDECLKAEKTYDKQLKEKEAARAKASEERKVRAKEVEDAFNAVIEAVKLYLKKRDGFSKDFGGYHVTFTDSILDWDDLFNGFCHII